MTARSRVERRASVPGNRWTERVIVADRVGVEAVPEWLERSYQIFREHVLNDQYPCFFGTRAESRGEMFYSFARGDDWSHLGAALEQFCILSRRPEHARSNFAVFFEPRAEPLDHDHFRSFCWDVLQYLHDGDSSVSAEAQIDPSDPAWEFTAYDTQIFVVGCSPSYKHRHSRNLGPGIILMFQPRSVFVDQVTKKAIGREARAEVRRRLMAWDDPPAHPDLGVYGDPENREWKQYFLPDDNTPERDRCPFLDRRCGEIQDRATDIVAILRQRAALDPERIAMRFVCAREGEETQLSYAELDRHARRLAVQLRARAEAGERALLFMPTGPEYVAAFFGCLYAGIIAVPAFPASAGNAQHLQRLRGMLQDAQPRLLLTDEANETKLANLSLEGNGASAFVVRLEESGDCEWEPAPLDPDAIAFLQYTSGSTAAPKGVMVTHGNLIANGAVICAGMKLDERAVLVSWLPLYHDMGLISGVVVPVYCGFPVTLMSSQLILERPATWLRAIARYRATISGGPDFAFPLCVDRIKDEEIAGIDLSCWRVAFCGSEPISSQSMSSFASRFAPYGFNSDSLCPCYGLAEATLMVSSARAGEGARARHFDAARLGQGQVLEAELGAPLVDCGVIPARHRVTIVEPSTGRVCEAGEVGEIWVSGPSISHGYWQNEAATERTFPSLPAGDGTRVRYLRTGDLGFVLEGRVFVSGRLKDLIIVRGQNLYPQDIERALLGAVPSLRRGRIAAFPVTGRGGEGIGIAAELSSAMLNKTGADAVIAAIRRALASAHHESAELIVLLKAGQLPRTSSGKLRRSACAAGIHDGSLKPSATYRRSEDAEPAEERRALRVAPRTVTEHALASIWAEVLGKREFGIHDDFFEAGGESLAAANLLARVEKAFELELRLESIFEARTIEHQAQLLQAKSERPVRSERRASLPLARVQHDSAPLSHGQRSLWFLWKLAPESSAYTLVARVRFAGDLDVTALRRAIVRLVERHEPLRTQFEEENGVPRQRIRADAAFDWQEFDLSNEEPVRREARLSELLAQLERKPFDLVAGPLLRAQVVTLPEQRQLLLVALHHIAADAGSVAVLWRELAAFYEQERTGARRTLDPLPSQYADYALQQSQADTARFETQLAYWRERLAGERPVIELPGRLTLPGADRDEAARIVRDVSSVQAATLRRLSHSHGATLSQLLLATFDILLHRYSNEQDIWIGVPVTVRGQAELEGLIGYFVNLVVQRVSVHGALEFAELLSEVRARMLEAQQQREVPFERVVAALDPERSAAHNPLFSVTFNHRRSDEQAIRLPGVATESAEIYTAGAPFDWTLDVAESDAGLRLSLEFRRQRFDPSVVDRVLDDYLSLLTQVSEDANVRVGALRLSGQPEVAVERVYRGFIARFQAQAAATPSAIALVCEGQELRYAELHSWARRVGRRLERDGILRGERIGLAVERSPALVAGLTGILSTGAAFVPLDPAYPKARLERMMADAGVQRIVTDERSAERLRELFADRTLIVVSELDADEAYDAPRSDHPEELAYVMFTSGSSGRPKGVEVSQRALSLHIDDYLTAFEVTDKDTVLQFSTVNFDAALEQMLPILTIGGRLVMRGSELWTWEALNRCLQSERVSLAYLPTGYFRQWLAELPAQAPPSLRLLTVGGEALAGAALAVWRASALGGIRLENTYGPTEATITTSAHITCAADVASSIVPIGKSLLGRRAALLSEDGDDVPIGGIGELCIGGASLARGYLGAPALTAERFVPDPRGSAGERLYRTGDRCRRRLDGTFEFLGRRDTQVKLRGYRIELGEVETALRLCAGVTDAVVSLSGEGERARLVGYMVGRASVDAVRVQLEQTLPAYMVPVAFVPLERIPLLPNGKVARKSLPDAPSAPLVDTAGAPRTAPEETLLSIWKQVLRREDLGIRDDFFALGGDSILSLQVIARAVQAGLRLTPKQLFDHPTVEGAAQVARFQSAEHEVRSQRAPFTTESDLLDATGLSARDIEDAYPATPAQQGLLFHEAFEQTRGVYVYQVRLALQGSLDHAAFRQAWEAAIQRHEVLRSSIVWRKRGGAVQVVCRSVRLPYFEHDGSALADDYEAWLAKLRADDVARGFDLEQAPLMRVHVVSRSEQSHDLVWTNHHAILDGWSAAQLLAEVLEDHEVFAAGGTSAFRTSLSYGDYVRWLAASGDHEAWWRGELGRWNSPAILEDGIGRSRQAEPGTHHLRSVFSAQSAEALRQAAARARVTLHTMFQAAWAAVLARYAGRAQALFGSVLSGRPAELAGSDRSVGLFIHTLPMRVDLGAEKKVDEWLREVQRHASELIEHQSTPLGSIQKWAGASGHSLFDTVLVFENYPIAEILGARSGRLVIGGIETADRTHYPLTLTVFPQRGRDRGMELEWEWDGSRVDRSALERLTNHYLEVLEQIGRDGEQRLAALELSRTACELQAVTPVYRCVLDRIDEQTLARSAQTAIWCEHEALSYGELGSWSRALARKLRESGVQHETLVGLCVQRKPGLVAAVLGIWKAGGAMVPLDPSYPEEQLERILRGIAVVVVDAATRQQLQSLLAGRTVVELGELPNHAADVEEPAEPSAAPLAERLAYVIYTSGSTGAPKGVAVSQRALSAHVDDFLARYALTENDCQLFSSTINFDVWLHELLPALTQGGRVLMRGEGQWELATLTERLYEQGVTFARVSTAYWSLWAKWLRHDGRGIALPMQLRQVTVGGEGLSGEALKDWFSGPLSTVKLDNLYGPTETTVAALVRRTSQADASEAVVPIGRPFPSRSAFVIDASGDPVPVGGVGELCLGGPTVARGYLGRAAETAQRFVPDPHVVGGRLYRSGDLSRMRDDGTIEFLGRSDEQIKLRGYRIELGEVESGLRSCAGVAAAAAAVRGEGEHRRLVGYVTGSVDLDDLKLELTRRLPMHMLPTAFVALEALPLLANGKVDRRRLPEPSVPTANPEHSLARTANEATLQFIWQEVLGRAPIGVMDDYFSLGGDSILSLQIVALARQRGLKVTPRQLFEHPTIESLARVATDASPPSHKSRIACAEIPLTPIQKRFFDRYPDGPSHWNQSVLLSVVGELSIAALQRALDAVLSRHDAFGLRFERRAEGWRQHAAQTVESVRIEVLDLQGDHDWLQRLAAEGERVQRRFDLARGPLFGACCFLLPNAEVRLLLACHHLAIDGVSWRVLLDELEQGYRLAVQGRALELAPNSSTFEHWALELAAYAARPELQAEVAWWRDATAQATAELPALGEGDGSYGASQERLVRLNVADTRRLIESAPRAYRMRIDEVLLTALTQTLSEWSGQPGVLVDLEGHGREDILGDVDVSRTVGWFTTRFPVWLEAAPDAREALQRVKERLRSVPHKGIHWDLLDRDSRPVLEPRVSFNYLGRFDAGLDGNTRFQFADEVPGSPVDRGTSMAYVLDLNALVRDGVLSVSWRFSPAVLDEKIVESLVASFESRLRGLIEHAASVEPMWTPSDFPLLRSMLGDHELEARGLASSDIADLYPATPMQAGLLFHSVLEANRGLYIYQLRLTLAGPFEIEDWRSTWQAAIDRHDLLRTGFIWSDRGDALQVVRRTVGVPLEVDDWSTTDASGFEARLSSWLAEDRARGFDLDGPTLMRLHVFRRPDGHVDVVWTMHHAVSDGWSSARLLDEVFRDFLARRTGNRAALRSAPRYRDYVAWLRNQPSSESFWRARLASVDDPATLGTFLSRSTATEAHWRELSIRRDHTWLERLNVAARRQRVTPATLVQSAWALLLARYADRRQVVFGVTVAGRPAELPDADRMTGLFINSLPLWLDVPDAERTGEWLRTVQHQSSDLQQHGHVPLSSIQKWAGRPGEALFDSLVVIENYPVDAKTLQDAEIKLLDVQVSSRTHYPLSLTVTLREELELLWEWDLTRVDATAVGRITEHYCEILHALTADGVDEVRLEEIRPRPATPALRAPVAGAAFRSVSQRISDNAWLYPDAEAVRCDGASVSYGELETWSRAVASHLRARGVQRDERIGLCVERSPALVAALLGAWRAGAAYVPLDPTYPALRLRAMIDDAEIDTVLADDSSIERLSDVLGGQNILRIADLRREVNGQPIAEALPEQLAYVIFTSGSTGEPKGVSLSQRALAVHVDDYVSSYGLSASDRVYQFSTINFDASAEQLFPALSVGACVVMRGVEVPEWTAFNAALRDERVSVLDLPTSYWQQWLSELPLGLPSLRLVTVGGEALPAPALARWKSSPLASVRLDNSYGPTEAAIAALFHATADEDSRHATVPIGRPYPGRTARLLDSSGRDVVTGALGELCIGGDSLARGYEHRPALTADRFVPDSNRAGARLYRTGDICRRRDDGTLEFLGRRDAQIKLRGLRIELSEIERMLALVPGVKATAAVVGGAPGRERLVAYVVGDVDKQAVLRAVRERLPSYMVPSSLQLLDALPLRANGKVDLNALADPALSSDGEHLEPRTQLERALLEVWASVLGVAKLGVTDNFFALGGDSISSLLVVSRARALGFQITPKQLFERPTIAELALVVGHTTAERVQETYESLALGPIQAWFFEQHPQGEAHYNQSVLLRVEGPFSARALGEAMRALLHGHDSLRLRFSREGGTWRQRVVRPEEADVVPSIVELDLRAEADWPARLRVEGELIHRSLSLESGPLFRAAYFQVPGEVGRLLLVAHHLIIDGVSWRILLDRLGDAYQQAVRGAPVSLPPASTPWSLWAQKLVGHGAHSDVKEEVAWWQQALRSAPRETFESKALVGSSEERVVRFSSDWTRRLIQLTQRWGVEEVLLTALVQSIDNGTHGVLVDVEGHGRESLGNDELDLSRTLGWFTTQFPVWLESEQNAERALNATRARLRSVPAKGLHFGLLRFGADASVRAAMNALPRSQISFNYLGRFDGSLARNGAFSFAREDSGAPVAATSPISHALDVNALIIADELSLRLRVDPALMSSSALSELIDRFEVCLRALVEQGFEHAPQRGVEAFPLALLADAEADALDFGPDVEDVYPATPLQQGLLFHTLLGRSEGAYLNQLAVTIRGPLKTEAFFAAWRQVLERHPILRTSFEWKHGGAALQVVHRAIELPGALIDASDEANYPEKWAALRAEDRDRGVELQRAPLMRITLVRRPDGAHDLLWTTHHALLDGWSTSRVLGEVLEAYRFGRVRTVVPPPYRDYVAWLQRCPSSEAWWRAKLASVGEAAGFCDGVGAADTGTDADGGSFEQRLSATLSEELRKRAQRWQVTLPALVQAAWAILLSRYANRSHVVFGTTVSGRNLDLPGAEQMLGLFINSLPVWVEVRNHVSLADFARSILRYMSELGPHEQTPLHELQSWAGRSGTALFDSLLVFENYPVHEALSDHPLELRFEAAEMLDKTHYPLTLTIKPGASLELDWAWRGPLLDASAIERVAQNFSAVLEQLAHGDDRCVGDVRLAVALPQVPSLESYRFAPIVERVAAQVARAADACAVQCGEARLSYAQLDRWSAAIARRLRRAGVTSEQRVAVCVERSLALPAALLGVLRAGGAYLPLDPSYPASRLAYMLDDAAVRCVIADPESAVLLAECAEGRQIMVLDSSPDDDDQPDEGSSFRAQPAGLAYVLYTSGSTGRPKGVAVSHEALDRFLLSAGARLSFRTADVWLSVTSPSFDIFALELYLPLLTGARVEIAPRDHVTDGGALARLITASGATFLQATPVTWRALVDSGWRSNARLTALSGGEALAPDLAAALIERGVTLWNMYGPTETTIWSSAGRIEAGNAITLGDPFPDCPIRVVETGGELSPIDGLGEICIGGTNLARGYLGRPALTAERFVPDPGGLPGARLYRTGDAGRYRADGSLEFWGRIDQQVKLRGHRIELGEIELALRECQGVLDAAVVLQERGERRLVGYVTGAGEPTSIRRELNARLPSIMVPSAIVVLSALPRTLNNKLDRRALLELDQAAPHEPPRTPTEIALAELWGQVLGRERVGAQDDFFALGGHSLAAVRLVARIRRSFGRELPLHVVLSQSVLADQAKELAAVTAAADPIVPRRADDVHDIPLSLEQERLWFLWKLEPESVAYTVSGALRLEGELDEAALQSALGAIVGRHEILRTRFLDRAGVPRQVVVPTPAFAFTRHNLLESGAGELERRLNLANTEPFDLEGGPLLRARLLRCAAREHVLFLSVHHIVADGASIDLLLRELDLEYRAVRGDARLRPPALPIQYADYALWERNLGSDAKTDARLGFWRELLGTEHPSLELPVDRARRGARDGRGGRVLRTLAGPHIVALDRLSKRSGVTRFAILLAVFDVLLYRYSGQRDLRVGVPVSGRRHVETETLIGLFVNTWVLRLDVSASDPFEQLMRRAWGALASAEANQVPFARLVEALRPPRNTAESPLFRVTFNFEEAIGSGQTLGDLRVSSVAIREGGVPFDLMLDVVSGQDALELSFGYARDLFDASTVERLVDDFVTILETVTNDSKTLVGAVPLSVPAQLSPSRSYSFRSLLDRFSEQVALRPEAVALTFQGQSHTYRELDSWSNRIARRLRDCGALPEERVAICVDRSPAVVAAIIGTLKARAAYVPLDPLHPALRLRETLEDAGIARVLVDQRTSSELRKAWSGCEVIVVSDVDDASDEDWNETVLPEQLAYVIYTSGSTGKPKGVGVSHANVARLFDTTNASFGFGATDTWTLFHSPAFDFSVWEIFGALVHGGRLVIVPYPTTRDPAAFRRLLAAERVTVLNQTPSAFVPLLHAELRQEQPLTELRAVIFGGEKLDPAILAPWIARYGSDRPMLINMYGITETTVHVSFRQLVPWDVDARSARSVIGGPLDDLAIHVLDESLNAVPIGAVGEIYVGGAGVARGYLGRSALTAERFIPDPTLVGGRLYASGDRARRLSAGDLEYLGRADSQLKIRGHRVEIGEIEAALREHPSVGEVVVIVREDASGSAQLLAYFVARDIAPEASELRIHLAERIPTHMIPFAFVALTALPLTHNGKLDRSALPDPPTDDGSELTPPRTKMEELIARLYGDVLGKVSIGVEANFFSLGGHSLLAVRLAALLSEELGRVVETAAVFHYPSVGALARHLEADSPQNDDLSLMAGWLDSLD